MRPVRAYATTKPAVARPLSSAGWHATDSRSRLLDTRLVRAELARLRAPRPATAIPLARGNGSTLASRK
jgi:hypothetical protein